MGLDVIVSYAPVDDEPLPPATAGWVSTLVQALKVRLAKELERRGGVNIWMYGVLTAQIIADVRDSATMVIIYSPGYRASQWCNRENNEFLRLAGTLGSRLFVVERDREQRVPELADLRGYSFWVRDDLSDETRTLGDPVVTADDRLYFAKLDNLVTDLARELKEQRHSAPTPSLPSVARISNSSQAVGAPGGSAPRHQVFISFAFEDQQLAFDVVRALESNGMLCWIAKRDIPLGASYAKHIPVAIRNSRVMVVIVSEHSNDSDDVLNEITLARNAKVPHVPFRVDASPLSDGFAYFFGQSVWLAREGKETPDAIAELARALKAQFPDLAGNAGQR